MAEIRMQLTLREVSTLRRKMGHHVGVVLVKGDRSWWILRAPSDEELQALLTEAGVTLPSGSSHQSTP